MDVDATLRSSGKEHPYLSARMALLTLLGRSGVCGLPVIGESFFSNIDGEGRGYLRGSMCCIV